jgi:sialate O-acetylesterase
MRSFKIFTSFLLLTVSLVFVKAQLTTDKVWNNRKCAVSLTYDDGLNIHLDKVIPLLDSMHFKGTFYVPGYASSVDKRLNEWRTAAKNGHELGNHTLFHACVGNIPGREWVGPDYDLSKYTLKRMIDEVLMANTLLNAIDGKTKRSFAYTCGDTKVEDVVFMDQLKHNFISARGVQGEMLKITEIDIYHIGSFMMMNNSGEDMINLVKKAMETNSYLVFLFHGVGGEHNINVSAEAHRQLLQFLKQNEKDIWVAPFIEVSEYITDFKALGKKAAL